MIFHIIEREDGDAEIALDEAGIDYLAKGLEHLRILEAGEELSTPSVDEDGVSQLILKRVADED